MVNRMMLKVKRKLDKSASERGTASNNEHEEAAHSKVIVALPSTRVSKSFTATVAFQRVAKDLFLVGPDASQLPVQSMKGRSTKFLKF